MRSGPRRQVCDWRQHFVLGVFSYDYSTKVFVSNVTTIDTCYTCNVSAKGTHRTGTGASYS